MKLRIGILALIGRTARKLRLPGFFVPLRAKTLLKSLSTSLEDLGRLPHPLECPEGLLAKGLGQKQILS